MKSSAFIILAMVMQFTQTVYSQESGNSVTAQYYNSTETSKLPGIDKLYLSDTSFVVQANVLMNTIADSYTATFSIAEFAPALKDAGTKIDSRIHDFVQALIKLGVTETDIYVDMTTQTPVSDYKVNGNYSEQYITGYEQKKNVIVKFKRIKDLDKMVTAASDYGIYDIAKVDYIVTDINKIYSQLFVAATEAINSKKDLYVKAMNCRLTASSQIYGESFNSIYPPQLYKSYTPNITTEFRDYSTNGKRKDLRRNTTYYYDKISYSGFDKVINPVITEPAVEFVLKLQLKFNIDKR